MRNVLGVAFVAGLFDLIAQAPRALYVAQKKRLQALRTKPARTVQPTCDDRPT